MEKLAQQKTRRRGQTVASFALLLPLLLLLLHMWEVVVKVCPAPCRRDVTQVVVATMALERP